MNEYKKRKLGEGESERRALVRAPKFRTRTVKYTVLHSGMATWSIWRVVFGSYICGFFQIILDNQ